MAKTICVDESGCLGWSLTAPCGHGSSSGHFTLAAAILPDGREPMHDRIVRGLYKKGGRAATHELKSFHLRVGA